MKIGITAAFILLAACLASAQTNSPSPAPTNPPPPTAPDRNIPVSVSPFDHYFTADQRKVFDQAYVASQAKIKPLNLQIRQLRNEMSNMMFADEFDEAAFRAKSETIGKLQTQIDLLRVQAILAVRPMLSSNQVDTIRGPQSPPQPPAGAPPGAAPSKP
jgi:Spy/CpxP family protein refolding chaperone